MTPADIASLKDLLERTARAAYQDAREEGSYADEAYEFGVEAANEELAVSFPGVSVKWDPNELTVVEVAGEVRDDFGNGKEAA